MHNQGSLPSIRYNQLFLFDEFQKLDVWIQEELLDIDFLEFLRNQMLHSDRLGFVFTGTERLRPLEGTYWSILFNSAKYCEVKLLEQQAATELVTEPVRGVIQYNSETISRVFRFTGCHPYFLQLICSELVNHAKQFSRPFLRVEDVNAAAENAVRTGEGHLSYLWNKCSEAEQTLLKRIAHSVILEEPYLIQPSDFAGSQIIDRLLQWDILRRESEGCVFYAGLFYLWIKKNTSADSRISLEMSNPLFTEYNTEDREEDKMNPVEQRAADAEKFLNEFINTLMQKNAFKDVYLEAGSLRDEFNQLLVQLRANTGSFKESRRNAERNRGNIVFQGYYDAARLNLERIMVDIQNSWNETYSLKLTEGMDILKQKVEAGEIQLKEGESKKSFLEKWGDIRKKLEIPLQVGEMAVKYIERIKPAWIGLMSML